MRAIKATASCAAPTRRPMRHQKVETLEVIIEIAELTEDLA